MANMSGLLGTAGGFKGTGVDAPNEDYSYLNTVTPEQMQAMNARGNSALDQQQSFLQAVQAQNGLQNQSSVYNQLQGIANGTGPNPAMAQLNQTTGQNVANQAAMQAGQRGSSVNTGLVSRQAANTGANIQQQAVGQGAILQAQQSMNALNSMGNMANQQAGQQAAATGALNTATQNEQNTLLNQNAARAQAQAGVNSNRLALIGGTAAQQAAIGGGGASGIGAAMAAAGGGMVERQPMADGGMPQMQVQPIQTAPAPSEGPMSFTGKYFNGIPQTDQSDTYAAAANQVNSAYNQGSNAFSGMKKSGKKTDTASAAPEVSPGGAFSQTPEMEAEGGKIEGFSQPTLTSDGKKHSGSAGGDSGGGIQSMLPMLMALANGGKVPALLSPGERYLSPDKVQDVAQGKADPIKDGKKVPGKPKVAGAKNSYANDTFKTELDEGGIVIPRSITQGKDAEKKAMDFVRKCLAKSRKGLK